MMSHFAPEVAKYPKSSYFGSVRAYCFALLAMQLVIWCNYICFTMYFIVALTEHIEGSSVKASQPSVEPVTVYCRV